MVLKINSNKLCVHGKHDCEDCATRIRLDTITSLTEQIRHIRHVQKTASPVVYEELEYEIAMINATIDEIKKALPTPMEREVECR